MIMLFASIDTLKILRMFILCLTFARTNLYLICYADASAFTKLKLGITSTN